MPVSNLICPCKPKHLHVVSDVRIQRGYTSSHICPFGPDIYTFLYKLTTKDIHPHTNVVIDISGRTESALPDRCRIQILRIFLDIAAQYFFHWPEWLPLPVKLNVLLQAISSASPSWMHWRRLHCVVIPTLRIFRSKICSISAVAQKKFSYHHTLWESTYLTLSMRKHTAFVICKLKRTKIQLLVPLGHGPPIPKVLHLLRRWRCHFNDFPPFCWWWCAPQLSSLEVVSCRWSSLGFFLRSVHAGRMCLFPSCNPTSRDMPGDPSLVLYFRSMPRHIFTTQHICLVRSE